MNDTSLLELVDQQEFRKLFIDELGWNNPDRDPIRLSVEGLTFQLTQVANYRGLRIWTCSDLPSKKVQRQIDIIVGQENLERLIIFVGEDRQEWRWPRRAQTGGVNAKLIMHRHVVGASDVQLASQLRSVEIDLDESPTLVELLARMRAAFDYEAETASVQAARLMGRLYSELEAAGTDEDTATLLLARLLFLLFGDDGGMWKRDLFHEFILNHTATETLKDDLSEVFIAVNTPVKSRKLEPGSPLAEFRYINGGLFAESLTLSDLTQGFREGLLEACEFDWQHISPAVFGSMFQTVKSRDDRRAAGEFYTTEQNILRVIGPLLLDELHAKLESAWSDKGSLTRLHNEIGRLRVLDPACGCGNFLVVAYRELRALELEILKRRRDLDRLDEKFSGQDRSQMTIDVSANIKVTLDHFFGIELYSWPARIAETAMLLVDHLANQRMEEDFGVAPDRLPIELAPTIVQDNAIRTGWSGVVASSGEYSHDDLVIVGNPPFVGMAWLTSGQQEDNRIAFGQLDTTGLRTGRLDYVACWYAKAIAEFRNSTARIAFVSTNSITQGEQARSMVPLLAKYSMTVDFAHRTFKWTSEARETAAVHVVIVGLSSVGRSVNKKIYDYPDLLGPPIEIPAQRINFYLVDAPDLVPVKLNRPLVDGMPMATKGSQPTDDGHLIVTADDVGEVRADPVAARYLRPFKQTRELLYGAEKWCLWLVSASRDEVQSSAILRTRLDAVRAARNQSPTQSVQRQASSPHLFTQIRQPTRPYLVLPEVSSENREWVPGAFLEPDTIAGNKLIVWDTDDLWHFGVLQSSIYMAWIRAYCGRLESRLSLSPGLIYFPFPFVIPSGGVLTEIRQRAQEILDERNRNQDATLAEMYDADDMPRALRNCHYRLDRAVDGLYGVGSSVEANRLKIVMKRYGELMQSRSATGGRRKS